MIDGAEMIDGSTDTPIQDVAKDLTPSAEPNLMLAVTIVIAQRHNLIVDLSNALDSSRLYEAHDPPFSKR